MRSMMIRWIWNPASGTSASSASGSLVVKVLLIEPCFFRPASSPPPFVFLSSRGDIFLPDPNVLFFESIKSDRCFSDDGVCDGASLRALLPLSIVASEIPCLAPLLLAVLFIARVDAPARGIPEDRLFTSKPPPLDCFRIAPIAVGDK